MSSFARPLIILFVVLIGCFSLPVVFSEEVWNTESGWGVNIPETWTLMQTDGEQKSVNFSDSRGHAVMQIFDLDTGAAAFADSLMSKMSGTEADAGTSKFMFSSHLARLSDMRWKSGDTPVRGYVLSVEALGTKDSSQKNRSFVVVVYAWEEEWAGYHDYLLSALDSFFIGEDNRYMPGAISQLIANDGWSGGPIKDFKADVDAAQTVAEREAIVLSQYTKAKEDVQKRAWRRFYQIIYRDNYHRLDDVTDIFIKTFKDSGITKEKIPATLLAWIQTFKFEEYEDIADMRVPVDAIAQKSGDCDSRGLIYMILLDRMGFDSVLMISPTYHHAMVGVGITGPGFFFPSGGKNWMVAETTVKVPMGQIRSDMQDPKQWMGFDLHFTP